MKESKLIEANKIWRKIQEYHQAKNCFEWDVPLHERHPDVSYSRNPRLIIDVDHEEGEGRQHIEIPMNLSKTLIDLIKNEIDKGLAKEQNKFDNL